MQDDSVPQELLTQIVSPVVDADRRVTFRLQAPRATRVMVQGIAGLDAQPMKRGPDGLWECTIGPLKPELYGYVYDVDGTIVTDPQNRQVQKWLSLNSMFEVPGDPPLVHERQPVPHGVVRHHLATSRVTNAERGVYVYTPPGYRADVQRPYPLLVLLHGYGDDESAWLEVGRANHIADNLLAHGQIEPLIVAMPYGHSLPIDSRVPFDDYASRNLPPMEREILQDLLPLLNENYSLKQSGEHRAIVGLSMGGGQSLTIGLRHLDQFAWVGGFSSAVPPANLDRQYALLSSDAATAKERLRLLWIGCGEEDFLLQRNQRFVRWLSEQGVPHIYRQTTGGHDWSVWRTYLAEFLQLFAARD